MMRFVPPCLLAIVIGCSSPPRGVVQGTAAQGLSAEQHPDRHHGGPYRWKVNARDLDYQRYRNVLDQVYPLIFDGTILAIERSDPTPTGDGMTGVAYDDLALTIRVDAIRHGPTSPEIGLPADGPGRMVVIVNDVVSSFPSGPTPYFGAGPYRFFCDAARLDEVIRIGVSHLSFTGRP